MSVAVASPTRPDAPRGGEIPASICRDLDRASTLEWLETDGLGGYAAGTVAGLRTRRYHGLLFAAARPPVDRRLLLAGLETSLHWNGRRYDLGVNRYGDVVHPQGHLLLESFAAAPFPTRRYAADGFELSEEIFMPHGRAAVVVRWRLAARPDAQGRTPNLSGARLEVRPLVAFREDHALRAKDAAPPSLDVRPGLVRVVPEGGGPALFLAHDAERVDAAPRLYENFTYVEERARGFDHVEHLPNPCGLDYAIGVSGAATLVASAATTALADVAGLRVAELARRAALADAAPRLAPLARALARAADAFVVDRDGAKTLLAGYPWFVDWGRDAMIALPGLLLAVGRRAEARAVLATFAAHVDGGMLPNRFPDRGEPPEYNTVDAALWFVEAARAYDAATGDDAFLRATLLPAARAIVAASVAGTRHGIRVDADGLLRAGEPGVQLTWMDAKVGERVVTPRHGRPVEIQALWFNALRTLATWERRVGDAAAAPEADRRAETARAAFARLFWNAEAGCLHDVVADDGTPDPSIRPNQLFAVALTHPICEGARAEAVVRRVERDLLTPFGPRTLAPSDPRYVGRYEGGPAERDGAYHQGAVWPWLMGAYLDAFLRVHGRSLGALTTARRRLEPFLAALSEGGLGSLSELHDGDPPHAPRGAFAQAWSVAEILRLAKELA